jgi:hypothetical protein
MTFACLRPAGLDIDRTGCIKFRGKSGISVSTIPRSGVDATGLGGRACKAFGPKLIA